MRALLKVLISIFLALFILILLSIGAIFISDKTTKHLAQNLSEQITAGLPWDDLAQKIENDAHWESLVFHGPSENCGFVMRARPGNKALTIFSNKKTGTLSGLTDPLVTTLLKSCPKMRILFHPSFSFTKIDFEIEFDSNNKVVRVTDTRSWD